MNLNLVLFVQSFRSVFLDYLSLSLDFLFSNSIMATFFLILFILFLIKEHNSLFITCFSLSITAVTIKILKEIFRRPRPGYILDLPISPHSLFSFPSGHTAWAFLLAVVFSNYYPKYRYIFYIVAFLTGFSRMYLGVHYFSDVFFGAIIGVLIGFVSIKYEKNIYNIGEKIIKLKEHFLSL